MLIRTGRGGRERVPFSLRRLPPPPLCFLSHHPPPRSFPFHLRTFFNLLPPPSLSLSFSLCRYACPWTAVFYFTVMQRGHFYCERTANVSWFQRREPAFIVLHFLSPNESSQCPFTRKNRSRDHIRVSWTISVSITRRGQAWSRSLSSLAMDLRLKLLTNVTVCVCARNV